MTKKEKAATRRHRLRDCPFCLNIVEFRRSHTGWLIYCNVCMSYGMILKSAAKAAKAWNGVCVNV